jgi:DNA-binding NarL/FixJ family response regulator
LHFAANPAYESVAMRLSILIADDREIERQGIRTVLEARQGWRVCGEAGTGAEVIEKAERLLPDLLLLPVKLPDTSAVEVIPKVIKVCPDIKVVALARQGSGELAAKTVAAGANGLVMTSDTANDLLLAVQNIGRNCPYFSPEAVRLLQGELSKAGRAEVMPGELTPREREILRLLAKGQTNKDIASFLGISVRTVDAHRANIMQKLKLITYSDLVQYAMRHKLMGA